MMTEEEKQEFLDKIRALTGLGQATINELMQNGYILVMDMHNPTVWVQDSFPTSKGFKK